MILRGGGGSANGHGTLGMVSFFAVGRLWKDRPFEGWLVSMPITPVEFPRR
jgi:hypothetical protein